MSESIPTPAPDETPEEKAARKRSDQDQITANAISAALTLMETARDDDELQTLLAPRGYDAAELDNALTTLQAPAQAAYDARQTAIGVLRGANEALATLDAQKRKGFTDYREIARASFPAAADRDSLGLNGKMSTDLQKFLTAARASYGAGRKAPYTAKLSLRGYAPATIDAELNGLKALENLAKAQAMAAGSAKKATTDRDAAAKALGAWVSEFRKVAKRVLRARGDLLSKLDL